MAPEQQDIRVSWAEEMQTEPGKFHVTEHWLKTGPDYVGVYFTLRHENTNAIAKCHATLLHGREQQVCGVKSKTRRKLTEAIQETMNTWAKTSAGYPIVFG